MAVTAALVTVAATVGTTMYARQEQRDAKKDQRDEMAKNRQQQEDAKTQQETAMAARAQRARMNALAGGGYNSTIKTSPLGLSSGGTGKTELGA